MTAGPRPQVLDRTITAYRIGDPDGAYPIYDAAGSRFYPGRWNTAATPVIYASEHYSTAMPEQLVHGSGRLPPNQHFIEITIDAGLSYEMFSTAHHPGWDHPDARVAKAHGEAWARQLRSAILLVPSLVARMELNVVINPSHPEATRIRTSLHQPVWWDRRLFG